MIICLSGFATSGKDTFYKLLVQNSQTPFIKSPYKRVAFADELKRSTAPLIKSIYNIDIFNCTPEEKEIARPILISVGCWARDNISENYWVDKVSDQVRRNEEQKYDSIICDWRFESEITRLKEIFGSNNVVGINIIRTDSNYNPPQKELENQPIIDKYVDYFVKWKTEPDLNNLIPHIQDFERWLFNLAEYKL